MTVEALIAPPTQADNAWKDILNIWFPEFMAFFYPHLAKEIDWSAGYESLDKELQAITSQSMLGDRFVDKLVKVKLRQGSELWILLHTEIQGQKETTFEKRLFEYYYRLHDRYNVPIVTLVILTDNHLHWRPSAYKVNILGLEVLSFRFSSVKLLDYRNKQEILEQTTNPFGIIVQTQLAALKTKKDIDARLTVKLSLTRKLYQRGLNRDTILSLYKFIDWILTLPKDLAIRYNDYIHQIEEEHAVAYITTAERIGLEKGYAQGLQQGIQQGNLEAAAYITTAERIGLEKGYAQGLQQGIQQGNLEAAAYITTAERIGLEKGYAQGTLEGEKHFLTKLLKHRFEALSSTYATKIEKANAETLLRWGEKTLDAKKIEDVFGE
jgi:hypothetical protein